MFNLISTASVELQLTETRNFRWTLATLSHQEWGVCKDFGLFDEEFAADLVDEAPEIQQ